MARAQLRQFGPRVPEFIHEKLAELVHDVRPLGHPRVVAEDIVGALIDAATAEHTADALTAYNPKLGVALNELEDASK